MFATKKIYFEEAQKQASHSSSIASRVIVTMASIIRGAWLVCLAIGFCVTVANGERKLSEKTEIDADEDLPLSIFDLDKARESALNLANLIYQRFEFWNEDTYPFFIYSSNMP